MYAEKARRSSRVARQTHELLLRIVREREPDLGTHADGVARDAARLARALQLDADERDVIYRAAELHDIGKIAIPDEILRKAGPLDATEWELVRRHTLIGERILDTAQALRPVARIVRSTHERWDGAGYPDGLAGEAIPLGARIILVCDAFDAMTSERPYAAAMSEADAIAELRRHAGRRFDSRIVDAFVAVRAAAAQSDGSGQEMPKAAHMPSVAR
jgi:HD-GYP domain-containing protein (c-di-GMP phosphodiesterase class II)